ncbi:Tyrosine N-monooxygenase [Hordeum vulgare]|nr:Tyrosine N-monooxygenase [Hordeum vulgare]
MAPLATSLGGVTPPPVKSKATIDLNDDDEEDASSDDGKRSPTPKSVAYSKPKRPNGSKEDAKEKKKKRGDDELKSAMDALVKTRKEETELRRMARSQDAMADERRLAAEERRVVAEERKVALEEKKLAMKERARLLEWEQHLFFMDTSTFDDRQKEFINLSRDEALVQKRCMGMGGFGGMGATMGGLGTSIGGMDGFGATMGGMEASKGECVALELPWVAWEKWEAWEHLREAWVASELPWKAWEACVLGLSWEAWEHLRMTWVDAWFLTCLAYLCMRRKNRLRKRTKKRRHDC